MRQGWESQAGNWARFARTAGYDHAHQTINLPAFLYLQVASGDPAERRWQRIPLFLQLRAVKPA
jgi:hypothetical protein